MMKVIEVVEFYINNVHDKDNREDSDLFYEMKDELTFEEEDEFFWELEMRDIDYWGNKDYIKDQDFWDEHQKLVDKLDEEYLNNLGKDKED
jgi:hypothetical protein